MSNLRPRLCTLEKGLDGYGFHLHGEKGKTGQFIRLVEPDSPAATAGLLAGDRLVFVNGDSVEGESHQQVVARIRTTAGALELIVVDDDTAELLKKLNLQCRKEFATEGIPVPSSDSDHGDAQSNSTTSRGSTPVPGENGDVPLQRLSLSSKEANAELRPRLCHMKKGVNGYGFNLHSEKSKPGQFIRAVDEDSPAERSGLRPQDKIVQVNSKSVVGMQHSEVVATIKAGGDETSLLVVDAEAQAFFDSCNVLPTEEHLTGPLPEPVSNESTSKEEVNDKAAVELHPVVSLSQSSSSSSSSDTSLTQRTPLQSKEAKPEMGGEAEAGLALSMSLAQAKERAHQKRSAKKAPPMDWSKRNELFSNL